jgi:hypothetical protein
LLRDDSGNIVEEGIGNRFCDYIDRRYGSAMVNVEDDEVLDD